MKTKRTLFTSRMASLLAIGLIFLLTIRCSKSDDAAPVATSSCSVTFKGTTYSLNNVQCLNGEQVTASDSPSLTGNGKLLTLDFMQDYILFTLDASDADALYSSINGSGSGTVNIDPQSNKWTFSGTLENFNGDSESISGECFCKN